MKKIGILLLLFCILIIPTYGQKKNTKKGKNSEPQILYSLPKTVLSLEVEFVRTETKVGPYYKYGERYLALKNVATEDQISWKVASIRVTPIAVPDKEKTFEIQSTSGIWLNKKGILCGLNTPIIDPQKSINTEDKNSISEDAKLLIEDRGFDNRALFEEQLMANSVIKMAEGAAKQIYRIRESRLSLISGDNERIPADGKSLEIMLKEMDQSERALMDLFEGKTTTKVVKRIFLYTPGRKSIENEIAFRISSLSGIVEKDDLSGSPVYISITADKNTIPPTKTDKPLIYYNIPGSASVKITMDNKLMFEDNIQIAQMGSIQSIPSTYKNSKLLFDPLTGALISMEK